MSRSLTVGHLLESLRGTLGLEQIGAPGGLDREIRSWEISSPGLVLAGYTERFVGHRLQVLGETEISYLCSLEDDQRLEILKRFFAFPLPAVFITKAQEPPAGLTECAAESGVPLLRSEHKTNEFYRRIKPWLENEFAPATTLHGSLADVYGVGLLFVGQSGIGKSECVLDLVERGHRLVADDLVIASRRGNGVLIGRGHELQRHYMEVRGVGLVDIPAIFGIRAVRQQKRIEVVVRLEEWNPDVHVDRTGLEATTTTILDVQIPEIKVLLNPGKNITVIAEVIAMNHLLRYSGVDAAELFNQRLLDRMRRHAGDGGHRIPSEASPDVAAYLQEDDE